MGLVLPPMPLTSEQIKERIEAGAKTLEEIDPEFFKWQMGRQRYRRFMQITLITSVLILMFTAMAIL